MENENKCPKFQQHDGFKVLTCSGPLPEFLQESVDRIITKEGFVSYEIKCKAISTVGGNFLADLYEADIIGKTASGDKELNIFIKSKIDDANITLLDLTKAYSQETFFYAELSGIYDDLQSTRNIPRSERYHIVKSYDAGNPNAIILDNLSKKGFSTFFRMDVVSFKFAKLSVQQLARFHGLSWVLQRERPEYFNRKIMSLKVPFAVSEDYINFVKNMTNYAKDYVDYDIQVKLSDYLMPALKRLNSYLFENENVTRCLCHGDYRANNILMKKLDGEVTEVIPVDFQLLNFGNPVMDFIYFIFPCTDQDFRKRHLNDLKNIYYSSLAKFLKYFDMDVEIVFPRKEFESIYRQRLDYGLTTSLMLTPILFTVENDIPDFSKDDLAKMSVTPDPKMKNRVKGLIDDFQKWGVL